MVATLFAGLILFEPDLGTTIALMLMLAGMLVVAGVPGRVLAGAGTIAMVAGLAAIWIEPYRRARFLSFLDPWGDPENTGFQTVQAIIGIGSGGLTGKGLGEGVQKINYLPEQQTDMILAVIGEELGLIGVTAVIAAFAAFAFAGFTVALRCRDPFGKLLAAGHHLARLRAGGGEPRRRARDRAADGNPAPVRLVRRLEPRRPARGHRDPP